MKTSRSNVTRVRRPLTWKRVVRGLLFLVGLAGGLALSWAIAPHTDTFQLGASEARGALIGVVFGVMLMQLVREPYSRPGSRLPEGFGSSLDRLKEIVGDDPSGAED